MMGPKHHHQASGFWALWGTSLPLRWSNKAKLGTCRRILRARKATREKESRPEERLSVQQEPIKV
jgi:hypothetical protein